MIRETPVEKMRRLRAERPMDEAAIVQRLTSYAKAPECYSSKEQLRQDRCALAKILEGEQG